MTRRRKRLLDGRWLRRKRSHPFVVIANAMGSRHPKRRFMFRNEETGEERVAVTQVATHRGRVSARYQHHTSTRAGGTRPHPIQTKGKRRRRAKLARRSRKANR